MTLSRNKRGALQFGTGLMLALSIATLLGTSHPSRAAGDKTAAEVAKEPVRPPKPYRLPDGHPNWTGFWVPEKGLLTTDVGLGGAVPGNGPGALATGAAPPFEHFAAVKSPYKEQREKFMQEFMSGKSSDPVVKCFPPGMPRMMAMVYGMEILQTLGQNTITSEWQSGSRRIWLNQKAPTPADELDPSYAGESIGHWKGDTLIVDTVGIRDDVPLNFTGLGHSDKLHVVETFSEIRPGILQDKILVTDPDVFVAPWTEIETYRYRPDLQLMENECLDNNRNVGPNGEAVFK